MGKIPRHLGDQLSRMGFISVSSLAHQVSHPSCPILLRIPMFREYKINSIKETSAPRLLVPLEVYLPPVIKLKEDSSSKFKLTMGECNLLIFKMGFLNQEEA